MLNLTSYPAVSLQGQMTVPGDKSISHRAVILGAIANGVTEIRGFLESDDCMATVNAFRAMGVTIERFAFERLAIQGVGLHGLTAPTHALDCGNSGTSMRLLTGLLAAQSFDSHLIGDASLMTRPMARIQQPLLQMGAKIETIHGTPPLLITGGQRLRGASIDMKVASAQVKSGVLLAGLYALGETTVTESRPTRDHTERILEAFSYPITRTEQTITIHGQGVCQATSLDIPGDISSAAFFIVAASLIPNAELLIQNVGINPHRTGVIDILKRMGASIEIIYPRWVGNEPVADLLIKQALLHGIEIPASLIPSAIDEFPIIFIAAAQATGQTILRGAQELRVKECDRIDAMAGGLQELGIQVETFQDGVCINGGQLRGGTVLSRDDHRIAMAFAIAGLVASDPVTVQGCSSIATSFPQFMAYANQLHLPMAVLE